MARRRLQRRMLPVWMRTEPCAGMPLIAAGSGSAEVRENAGLGASASRCPGRLLWCCGGAAAAAQQEAADAVEVVACAPEEAAAEQASIG